MLSSLFRRLFRHWSAPEKSDAQSETFAPDSTHTDIPLPPALQPAPFADPSSIKDVEASIICREAVLDRQQKIIGYQFLLQKAAHAHIRVQNRRISHFYAEVLVQNLLHANIFPLLGQRALFIEIPDSFLCHPCLTQLPAANTFFILKRVQDTRVPTQSDLLAWTRALRKRGYRIGIPDPLATPAYFHLLLEVDLVSILSDQIEIDRGAQLIKFIFKKAPRMSILVHNLPSIEDFNFCHEIGATLFQGPFIVSRERWQKADLGPSFGHLATLIKKLQQDAQTHEIVSIFKQDAALTLRLLRYINSAANGLREPATSIGHAITLLGRLPLQRWLMLLLCTSSAHHPPRTAAVLETALIRARFMELISNSQTVFEREAIFLTGLLSLIDVILQQPIEHALETLSIADEIRDAIVHNRGNYAAMLTLARACETTDMSHIVPAAEACNIPSEQASARYMEALSWTLALQQEIPD